MKKLKVWGGCTFRKKKRKANGFTQARTIVCATTKKRAVELLGNEISMYRFNDYWCETQNPIELATATEEGIWVNQGDDHEFQFEQEK